MAQLTTRPDKFAAEVNRKLPGAHRQITVDDIRLLTECGLIKRYGWYDSTDIQTVIGILNYEQLREKRTQKEIQEANDEPARCRLCGKSLPIQAESKKGRPREYCPACESSRSTMRGRKWRRKTTAAIN